MDAQALIDLFRQRADDEAAESQYSDADVLGWLSEGEREACIRAKVLLDDTTEHITEFAIVAGSALLDLDPTVLHIEAATFTPTEGQAIEVGVVGMDWIRDQCDWRTETASKPYALAHLPSTKQARLWPTASAAGTLYLTVRRLPLNDMESLDDEPEIPVEHHDGLVDWALYRAYMGKDVEQEDPARAAQALAAFEARFGARPSADTMRRHAERRRITTKCI